MNMENISEEDSAMIETQEESHELEMEDQQIDINHLQNIFEKDVNENRKHKNKQDWTFFATQTVIEKFSETETKQNEAIIQLETRREHLLQKCENESHSRVKISSDCDKVKKNVNILHNYCGNVKQTLDKCITTKNLIEKSIFEAKLSIEKQLKEKDFKLKQCFIKNVKIRNCLNDLNNKLSNFEKHTKTVIDQKDNEILDLLTNLDSVKNLKEELENKNKSLIEDMDILVDQKGELLKQFTENKAMFEHKISELDNEIEVYRKEISSLENSQIADKQKIDNLEKEREAYQKSLDEQNEFMKEIQEKNSNLDDMNIKMEQEIEELKLTICDLENRIESLKNELATTKNMISQAEDEYQALKKENEVLEQKYEVAKQGINTLTEKLQEKREKEEKTSEIMNKYQEDLQQSLENIQKNEKLINDKIVIIEDLHTEINYLKKATEELEEEKKNLLEDSKLQTEKYYSDIENQEEEKKLIKEHCEEQIREVNEDATVRIKEIVDANETYKNELQKIRQNEQDKHSKEVSQLNETIQKMQLEISELRVSKQSLEQNLKQKIKESEKLTREILTYESKSETKSEISVSQKPHIQVKFDDSKQKYNKSPEIKKPERYDSDIKSTQSVKPAIKRSFTAKIREPLHWDDEWSDSSLENEYMNGSWKKQEEIRPRPLKRRVQTQLVSENKQNIDEVFESLKDTFKQPQNKRPRSRKTEQN